MPMELIERIKYARERAGMSPSDLAETLKISPQAVQNWEYGKTAPKLSRFESLAEALDVSKEWLMTGKGKISLGEEPLQEGDDEKAIQWLKEMDSTRKREALELLELMVKQQRILDKYNI